VEALLALVVVGLEVVVLVEPLKGPELQLPLVVHCWPLA
jgi:hypothetical protein